MNKKVLFLAAVVLGIVNFVITFEAKDSYSNMNLVIQNASADEEGSGTYYDNREDEWDSVNHCYRQCVADGSSCYYYNNYPYAC